MRAHRSTSGRRLVACPTTYASAKLRQRTREAVERYLSILDDGDKGHQRQGQLVRAQLQLAFTCSYKCARNLLLTSLLSFKQMGAGVSEVGLSDRVQEANAGAGPSYSAECASRGLRIRFYTPRSRQHSRRFGPIRGQPSQGETVRPQLPIDARLLLRVGWRRSWW